MVDLKYLALKKLAYKVFLLSNTECKLLFVYSTGAL